MARIRSMLVAGGLLLFACAVDQVDLEGKQCPCAKGWTCDPTTQRCVQPSGSGGAGGTGGSAGSTGGAAG
ncbi:MAG: hypothetical protein L6Q84_35705, partial [Polyangiaceae bacterium]|nr:hypothetical protein [Polyangiaceae bacterium]